MVSVGIMRYSAKHVTLITGAVIFKILLVESLLEGWCGVGGVELFPVPQKDMKGQIKKHHLSK